MSQSQVMDVRSDHPLSRTSKDWAITPESMAAALAPLGGQILGPPPAPVQA